MADTRQVVNWSLERKCNFRAGDDWFLPNETYRQLSDLRTLARAHADDRVVDGICVTGWTIGRDNSGGYHEIPVSGFPIEDRVHRYGGIAEVHKTCGECEANADSMLDTRIAGCFGYLEVSPDSPELDEQLWKIIDERDLGDRLKSTFLVTTPLWYGFWIESPLRRLHAELLHELLDAACDHDDPRDKDVVHFLNALQAAINWELPVHVSLAPLGHSDFGWHTVFPHCPRCKANAPVGRWQKEFPNDPYQCKVCAHIFNPNEHHSSKRDNYEWDANSLKDQLGERGYEDFTKRFLLHRGCAEQQVKEIIDNENNGPLLRQIAKVRRQRNATLRKLRADSRSDVVASDLPRNLSFALSDDVDLELVLVPTGEFLMGSADANEDSNEVPQHLVRFDRPFYIGRFLVSQTQWQTVMGPMVFRKHSPDLPVDQVSWFDCQEFCEKLSARQKRVIRLPSEAEWEYACRAGTTTKFAFGDSLSTEQANFTPYKSMCGEFPMDELQAVQTLEKLVDSGDEAGRKSQPTPVGTYPPNAWGIYDMHGNVDEWCEDVWHANYEGAPTDGSPWLAGEDRQPFRVVRGGWCSATEFVCTSASRRQLQADAGARSKPETGDEGKEDHFLDDMFEIMYIPYGFRVVCEV